MKVDYCYNHMSLYLLNTNNMQIQVINIKYMLHGVMFFFRFLIETDLFIS